MLLEDKSLYGKTPIVNFKDEPIIKSIQEFFKKNFKKDKVQVVYINENGDVWEIGLRFTLDTKSPESQKQREKARAIAYEMKRALEENLIETYNIPNMSIQGLKVINDLVEFGISFIYANKNNIKMNYENKTKQRVSFLIESILEEVSLDELEKQIKEWELLDAEINAHIKAFESMIKDKLEKKEEITSKVFNMLEQLNIKNHQVGNVVVKMKEATTRKNIPYKELWTEALKKVNTATKKVLLALQDEYTTISNVSATRDIKNTQDSGFNFLTWKKRKDESVGDFLTQGWESLKSTIKNLFFAAKEYIKAANELQALPGLS
jgi:hypothetical protein